MMLGNGRFGPKLSNMSSVKLFRFLTSRYSSHSLKICKTENVTPRDVHMRGYSRGISYHVSVI